MSAMMESARVKLLNKVPYWEELKDKNVLKQLLTVSDKARKALAEGAFEEYPPFDWEVERANNLLSFFADRLKVALKEQGTRHDLIDAVFSLGSEDDLVRLVARVEALQKFLKTDDGANLLAGYKRAANILKLEEKKDNRTYLGKVDEALLAEPAEQALHATLAKAIGAIGPKLDAEDFEGAMREMAALRAPVDAFFDTVKVNADDPVLRDNRLNLLAGLRAALHRVADFSKIEG